MSIITNGSDVVGHADGQVRAKNFKPVSSATYTVLSTDDTIVVDCSANDVVLYFPTVALAIRRKISVVVTAQSNNFSCKIVPFGTELINGINAAIVLSHAGDGVDIEEYSSKWYSMKHVEKFEDFAHLKNNADSTPFTVYAPPAAPTKVAVFNGSERTSGGKIEANTTLSQMDLKELRNTTQFEFRVALRLVSTSNQGFNAGLYVNGTLINATFQSIEAKGGVERTLVGYAFFTLSNFVTVTPTMTAEIRIAAESSDDTGVVLKAGSSFSLERVTK